MPPTRRTKDPFHDDFRRSTPAIGDASAGELTAGLAATDKAEVARAEARERLSWRDFGLIGASGYAMTDWQRAEISGGREELANLQELARAVAATAQGRAVPGRRMPGSDRQVVALRRIDPTTADILSVERLSPSEGIEAGSADRPC